MPEWASVRCIIIIIISFLSQIVYKSPISNAHFLFLSRNDFFLGSYDKSASHFWYLKCSFNEIHGSELMFAWMRLNGRLKNTNAIFHEPKLAIYLKFYLCPCPISYTTPPPPLNKIFREPSVENTKACFSSQFSTATSFRNFDSEHFINS